MGAVEGGGFRPLLCVRWPLLDTTPRGDRVGGVFVLGSKELSHPLLVP